MSVKNIFPLFGFLVWILASCTTPVSSLSYLQHDGEKEVVFRSETPDVYRIKVNDNLYIRVVGEDEQITNFLNLSGRQGNMGGSSGMNTFDFITYVVDADGVISMPQIGRVKVEGLTIREVEDILTPKVNEQVENTSVVVRVVNRRVSVLGEVNSPGSHQMLKYNQTIFETIAMAGDLSDYGNRRNVKLIRETAEGQVIATLDLTNPSLMTSPYYYTLPNDVLYVEPRDKLYGTKTLPYTGPVLPILSIVSSALAIALFFIK